MTDVTKVSDYVGREVTADTSVTNHPSGTVWTVMEAWIEHGVMLFTLKDAVCNKVAIRATDCFHYEGLLAAQNC